MIKSLSASDPSNIRSDWTDRCRKGKDLLDQLDNAGPQKMKEIGLESFASGERKIFELNEKGDIPSAIQLMAKLQAIDALLIKQFADDIAKERDGDKIQEKMLEESDAGASGFLKDALRTAAEFTARVKVSDWLGKNPWAPYINWVVEKLPTYIIDHDKAVKEKRLLKEILLRDIQYVTNAKDQLSTDWIKDVCGNAEKFCESIQGTGKGDNYEARDWDRFQRNAKDRLADVRSKSIDASNKVFQDLLPAFREEVKNKFLFVMNDESALKRRRQEIDDDFKTMEDLFQKEKQLIEDLEEGRVKQTLKTAWEDGHQKLVIGVKLLIDKEKEEDEVMKK
jgi:hypothetical protein